MIRIRKFIRRADLRAEPDTLFVFGDNMARRGFGGQAKEMRGEPNAVGIPTKMLPATTPDAYFTDTSWFDVRPRIDEAFDRLEQHLRRGGDVVFPTDGIGTGRAQLATRAPAIAAYILARQAHLNRIGPRQDAP